MRVLCSGLDGSDLEGEVIAGEFYDADTGLWSLEETFTIRCGDGNTHQVHRWLVCITLLEETRPLVM